MKKIFFLLAATVIIILPGCGIVSKPIVQIPLPAPESENTSTITQPTLSNTSDTEFQNNLKNKTTQEQAELTLVHYFDLLNQKEYVKTTIYNGHGYETLQNWNPDTNPTNYAELIKYGCENNGWQCLKIKKIISKEEINPNEFKFVVQFLNNDGTLFERGPCCGSTEAEMPTKNKFEFIVKKIDNIFKVITSPVYIP
ncbi:MAG: hypothetical protein US42_C0011G0008 [Candidatus Magasanikbacteria bacterium GW2011_GWC2_37_14]|uniref:Uncharacterized protein n=1 Tax=Candidatus Magasanikbacteria bacterium GW2011_GWC2_37_14 TaxID=1619046 RepID=A0A0G0GM85_9BACT|nr:MAG: hypothetical protein US42_C0011G0008 [Candidatus Magasanikbacteria bacterium GW2011_GWC2_37_14]